ncbi:hypothetical protein GH714_016034 [Hevea brasiliensis]|uniref:Carbohydrate kinase PfkB domain-containing protein n=1 Tax=Hevea brasiliensis TaxID=3981 RepID=A0A6A6L9A8_HEVBR|nr:hypothetical protein GH714_016034 [Hevea brasiliensis]
MGTFLLLPQLHYSRSHVLKPNDPTTQFPYSRKPPPFGKILKLHYQLNPPNASINGDSTNGAIESPKTSRRGRKKKPSSAATPTTTKRSKRSKKIDAENGAVDSNPAKQVAVAELNEDIEDYDDGMDFPYDYPPLICCFGAAQKEFVPTVRVHDNQMHPDMYSQWKMLQWDPPEFARAPGGSPSNVAISHVRLGGRAAFMGKVGDDDFGEELVLMMNKERVQTRAVKFDENVKTACSFMKVKFEGGKMKMEMVKEAAEDSLLASELNLAVLKEARIFHFNSEALTSTSMQSSLFSAIKLSKKFGGLIFLILICHCLCGGHVMRRGKIHYYSTLFDGVVVGTEDVLITPFTCDRTGSGDAVVAAIMRKLTTSPEMFENQDVLERELRFAVAAGIISQWTIGAVRGFPTESATQNLKEQVYVPSMW